MLDKVGAALPGASTVSPFKRVLGLILFGIGGIVAVAIAISSISTLDYSESIADIVGQIIGKIIVMAIFVWIGRAGLRMAQLDSTGTLPPGDAGL